MNLIVKNSTASGQQTKKVRRNNFLLQNEVPDYVQNALASFDVVSLDSLLNVIFPWGIIVLPILTLFESWTYLGRKYPILIYIYTTAFTYPNERRSL